MPWKMGVIALATLLSVSAAPVSAQVPATGAPSDAFPCAGNMGTPHFSVGTLRDKSQWQIHAQARNWCSTTPNELAIGGRMFRSSWRGWIEEPHVGNYANPTIGSDKTSRRIANKFVLVADCEPETWYRWRARIGSSANINGKPAANLNPIMQMETEDEIRCGSN